MVTSPKVIKFESHGSKEEGYLDVASFQTGLPFEIKRVFWVYDTPSHILRGHHAHHETEMVLIAIKGIIKVKTEIGKINEAFELSSPNDGLYLPKLCWHEMSYSKDAVQLVLASSIYNVKDYIRDYNEFIKLSRAYGEE